MQDRNFDDLAERFSSNIYRRLKGQVRLAVLRRDFHQQLPQLWQDQTTGKRLRILDAGGGPGIFSAELAALGHQIVYCDISTKMLAQAEAHYRTRNLQASLETYHESVQSLLQRDQQFDLILLHAVLEWVAQPKRLLQQVVSAMQSHTWLSLLFYNQHSLVFRNLLRGNFIRAGAPNQAGDCGSLTPLHPLDPDEVRAWLASGQKQIRSESGVRVFADYGEKPRLAKHSDAQIIETELAYSQRQPYCQLGRYLHFMIAAPGHCNNEESAYETH